MFFSKLTNGFYLTEINGENIPKDAVEISEDQYLELLEAQSQGMTIGADKKGNPIAIPRPVVAPVDPRTYMTATVFQAKAALARLGKYDAVTTLMSNPATPLETRLAWDNVQIFRRLSPTVLAMGQALQLTDADLDELFTLAATIEA